MVSKLVAVDGGLHLPTAVRNQLSADLTADMSGYVTAATTAAGSAATSATNAAASAVLAASTTDDIVSALIEDTGSDTYASLDALIGASTGTEAALVDLTPNIPGAVTLTTRTSKVYRDAYMTTPGEVGFAPDATNAYGALWTRDHAYTVWHMPNLLTADEIASFVRQRLATRSASSTADPDGGTFGAAGANFICDRISNTGVVTFKNAGASKLPFMDGIAFVVLALWSQWKMSGTLTLYTEVKADVDTCLAAIPRAANGCVYSDPANPSVDYGFTDGVKKTGNVAYGTALQAWAYKMMAEMAGETTSGPYTTLRLAAQSGLATLRQSSGWYSGSSVNNAARDDVWATALIVAEGLCTAAQGKASALTLRDAYLAGTITSRGWVRHMPVGQYWVGTSVAVDTYQNGGYWLTPIWDCYRAVSLVDPQVAYSWVSEAMGESQRQFAAEGTVGAVTAPYEWFFQTTNSGPKGYTASAAIFNRFATGVPHSYSSATGATSIVYDDFATTPAANWTMTGFSWNSTSKRLVSAGSVDGETAIRTGSATALAQGISARVNFSVLGSTFPGLILRYVDNNNYLFASIGGATGTDLTIYEKISGTTTARGTVTMPASVAGVDYRMTFAVSGTTMVARVGKYVISYASVALNTAGRAGFRHGRLGAGFTTYDDVYITTINSGLTTQTVPTDLFLAYRGGVLGPGDLFSGPIAGEYRFIGGNGSVSLRGQAGAGFTQISNSYD